MRRLGEVLLVAGGLFLLPISGPLPLDPMSGVGMSANAVQPNEVLPDAGMEQRARSISAGLRCLVCQNQSIDDSDADLARDLRVLVRERLQAGDSDGQVIDYIVARYGEFVLLKPRLSTETLILWGTPVVLLLAGGTFALLSSRRRRGERPATSLTPDEELAVEAALREKGH
jgi:cytochrome c-type biogenesis protein CcmH